jgi:hypothetical protein
MSDLDQHNREKRRKRIITDARKEQNRAAQKAYRKFKLFVEELNLLVITIHF